MFIQNAKEIRQEKQREREIAREEKIQEKLDEEEQFREEERAAAQKSREEEEQEKKRGEKQAEAEKESQRRRNQRLKENFNHKYTQIAWYVVITVVIIYILLKILDHLGEIGAAIGAGLGWLSVLLKPLIIGFAIAYLLYPLDNFFQRQLLKIPWFRRKRLSARGLAVGITAVIAVGIIAAGLSAIVSTVTRELTVFHVNDIDKLLSSLQSSMNSFYNSVIRVMNKISLFPRISLPDTWNLCGQQLWTGPGILRNLLLAVYGTSPLHFPQLFLPLSSASISSWTERG